ncbi:hypothetical protein V8D89_013836 [Ganoderma adspersum]
MTVFLPLDASASLPSSPVFLVSSPKPEDHVKWVITAILKARRIVIVSGAGISVQAGIPDFRSSEGLFQSLKKEHPGLSGKDLFDASVFKYEHIILAFCKMIARLSQLSEEAEPTMFHQLLRVLDDRRCLLRVYTQNIDSLEEKSGLTFGVPCANSRETKHQACKTPPTTETPPVDIAQPETSTMQKPSPPVETPKCIPLHVTLQLMHCMACTHSYPLRNYIRHLVSGILPPCPQCTALEETRQHLGKRPRSIAKLRPNIVLYSEDHKDGEVLGNVIEKDLTGRSLGKGQAGPDLLLVVGTSLRILGTKSIVRGFSKAVRSRHTTKNAHIGAPVDGAGLSAHSLATSTPSSSRSLATDNEPPVQTIYLNQEFPAPAKEWEGVFDVWICGDAQAFARMVSEELDLEKRRKEVAKDRKRKREEVAEENC